MVHTTQEALENSAPTAAVVLSSKSDEIRDETQYPQVLRQMEASPEGFIKAQEHIEQLHHHQEDPNAFFVVDLGSVEARVKTWTTLLPQVEPFYAVKCNPDAEILKLLADLGCGFDCASRTEVEDVLRHGVAPRNIIYANPCKQASHITFAASKSVHMMTFDSTDELDKIHQVDPLAEVVLRLYVDDTKSAMRLGTKFGALMGDVESLFAHAKRLSLAVIGISFHVGSGCFSGSAYSGAIESARQVFDIGASMGFEFSLLDIGGGFPSIDGDPIFFQDCAKEISTSLQAHFPETSPISGGAGGAGGAGVRVIAEPGRFFVAPSHTLAVNVIGRKTAPVDRAQRPDMDDDPSEVPTYMYFVNDGIYGSFNGLWNDHPTILPVVLSSESPVILHTASIWGPTCDGSDCVLRHVQMPVLSVGGWILFPGMGAYSSASSSHFNGFAPPEKIYMQPRKSTIN